MALQPYSLSDSQFIILKEIKAHDEITLSILSELMNLSPSTLSRSLDSLERRDIILRIKDSYDNRVNYLILSNSGIKMLEEIDQEILNYYTDLLTKFPQKEQSKLLKMTNSLIKASGVSHLQ
jgi:MarR family transcriptional regulator for hemolysin